MDSIIAFLAVLQAVYGPLRFLPIADGTIHRFHALGDKPGSRNGWYVLHLDSIAFGCFGSWKTGEKHRWSSRKPVDALEVRMMHQRSEHTRRQQEAEKRHQWQTSAEHAHDLLSDASPADPYHPYLLAKGCHPHGLRQRGDELLVPICYGGKLVNLQRIKPDGSKRPLFGGIVKGCYSPLGKIISGESLSICEGWATGATIHEETGSAVACAMSCSNLLLVGAHLYQRYPYIELIIAGDDDRLTKGNPGRTSATMAAAELGCGLVFPLWPDDAPMHLTDFNDLRLWRTRQ